MRVTPSQCKAAFELMMRRIEPSPPRLRDSEIELVRLHARPIAAFVDEMQHEPDLIEALRERVRERRAAGGAA